MMSRVISVGPRRLGDLEPLAAAHGMEDLVALVRKVTFQQVVGGLVVVDDQDRAAARRRGRPRVRSRRPRPRPPGRWPAA